MNFQFNELMSPDELDNHLQLLKNPETQETESIYLSKYFRKNPYLDTYNRNLLDYLQYLLKDSSEYGIKGVNAAARIILSFVTNKDNFINSYINNEFCQLIWPYMTQSNYVMDIFIEILAYKYSNTKSSIVFNFLIEHDIFNVINHILDPESDDLLYIIELANVLSIYKFKKSNQLFEMIQRICQITFTSNNKKVIKYGTICLGYYGQYDSDIGQLIISNELFQSKINEFEQFNGFNEKEIRNYINMIDKILQNKEYINDNGIHPPGSKINSKINMFKRSLLIFIFKIICSPEFETNFDEKPFWIISHLFIEEEDVDHCIEIDFVGYMIRMISSEISFDKKVPIFASIMNLMELSSKNAIQYFIENGFFDILDENIDQLMNVIPSKVISALTSIVLYGETNRECFSWPNLVFNDNVITTALQKAIDGEYPDDYDHSLPLSLNAIALMARKNNDPNSE